MEKARNWQLILLGGFQLKAVGAAPTLISSKKARAVIAYLALSPNMTSSREKLIGLLWGDSDNQHARNNLRQTLVGLRRDLSSSDLIVAEGDQLRLREERLEVDYLVLTKAIVSIRHDEWIRAASLYSGLFLEGLALADNVFEDWARDTREHASNIAVELLERLIAVEVGPQRVRRAQQLVALDRFRETSQLLLIDALIRSGQIDVARRQYQSYVDLLTRELDATPSEELKAMVAPLKSEKAAARAPLEVAPVTIGIGGFYVPSRPHFTIAILPFSNRSTDPAFDDVAEEISEGLSVELSQHPRLAVLAASSIFPSTSVEACQKASDFIIQGNIRKVRDNVRLHVHLVDCVTRSIAWSERFERPIDTERSIQDDFVADIVSNLSYNLSDISLKLRLRDPASFSSNELLLLKAGFMWRAGDESGAQNYCQQLIAIDPQNPHAHSFLAFLYSYSTFSGVTKISSTDLRPLIGNSIATAMKTGAHDLEVLADVAATQMLNGDLHEAQTNAESSLKRMPHLLDAMHTLGVSKVFLGDHLNGLALIQKAMGAESRKTSIGHKMGLSDAYYMSNNYSAALCIYDTIANMPPYVRMLRAASLAQLRRIPEAKANVARALSEAPRGFEAKHLAKKLAAVCAQKEDAEHWLEGFHKAGVHVA